MSFLCLLMRHAHLYLHYQKTDRFHRGTQNHVDPPIFHVLYSLLEMVGGGAPLCFDLVLVIFAP